MVSLNDFNSVRLFFRENVRIVMVKIAYSFFRYRNSEFTNRYFQIFLKLHFPS